MLTIIVYSCGFVPTEDTFIDPTQNAEITYVWVYSKNSYSN